MKSFFCVHNLHKFSFFFLLLFSVLDPGNDIFRMKELFFVSTFLIGLIEFKKNANLNVLICSVLFSLVFPLIWLFLGYGFNYNFSFEYGMMYLKSFAFFLLINVSLDYKIDFQKQFAIATLILIPITIFLFMTIEKFDVDDVFYVKFDKTFVISRRAFGSFVFDPVVFYKTSPLLIFGLSFLSQQRRFKYLVLNFISILLCLVTLIISGTRANILGAFIILIVFFYRNYISISKTRKLVFWFLFSLIFVFYLIPFLGIYVFDTKEQSNEVKLSVINDYFSLWSNNYFSILFGQGMGGGFNTIERGLSYLAEPTYFEIVRIFGLVGGLFFLFFLIIPFYLFSYSKSSLLYKENYYMFIAYIIYVCIEIPSNPLLLSSTGMLVMVVIYSISIKMFISHRKRVISNFLK